MNPKRALLLATKLAISGLLLWLALRRVEVSQVVARLHAADLLWLAPALAINPIAVLLSAWRWQILSHGLLRFGEAVRYTWIGLFFGTILPGIVGGDLAKGISLATKESRARDARLPLSILMDKVVGFWVLLLGFNLVALTLLGLQPEALAGMRGAIGLTLGVTGGGMVGMVFLLHPRGMALLMAATARLPGVGVRSVADRVLLALGSYRHHGGELLRAALISAAIHALNALSFWFAMRSLAIPAKLWFAAVFYPVLSALLALPVSISGIGLRDAFATSMFSRFGLDPAGAVAFAWLLLGLGLPNALVGGGLQLREIFRQTRRSHP